MQKFTTILLSALSTIVLAQSNQVLNSYNYLKNKEYDKAKAATDAAAVHETTRSNAKMFLYRGEVYRMIFSDKDEKVRALDPEAEEKSLDAYINCLKIDLKENAKDPVYKDQVKGPIVEAAAATNNKAHWYERNKEYDKAMKCYDLVEAALPYDFDQSMKRANLTKEKIMYNKFEMFFFGKDVPKTYEFGDKLIGINYKEPKVYMFLSQIALDNKDTAKALSYIEKGNAMFENNMDLMNKEINIYLARKKTDVLRDKIKAAIEVTPDNEVLHLILGNIYASTKDVADAEKEYLKAVELRPDFEPANYNLGVFYYSLGKEWNDKLNNLPPKDTKTKEFEKNKDDNFKKAVVYLEKSYAVDKAPATKKTLFALYSRLGDAEKAALYK
jgi:tetratricopeptide (TPR) repeat protein